MKTGYMEIPLRNDWKLCIAVFRNRSIALGLKHSSFRSNKYSHNIFLDKKEAEELVKILQVFISKLDDTKGEGRKEEHLENTYLLATPRGHRH